MIPFVNLIGQRNAYKPELEQAERAVFDSGCFVGGPMVRELETNLAQFCGCAHAVTCGSGTEALTVALMALGIKPGDEVIVPDFTFIASAECVAQLGGIPKFADVDPETLQISPKSAESLVGPATRGIVAVDLFGQCAPYKELREIANSHGLWILEDGAQAFGALAPCADMESSRKTEPLGNVGPHRDSKLKLRHDSKLELRHDSKLELRHDSKLELRHDSKLELRHDSKLELRHDSKLELRRACTFGDISITSFYPSKPLGCYGDGGAIFTDSAELADKVRQIANHGSKERYLHEIVGMNSRLDAIQAAVLNVKLKHFESELAKRRENATKYNAFFAGIEGIRPQRIADGNTSTYAQYTLLVDDREAFIEKLKQAEIPYCIHYPKALHCQPCFTNGAGASDQADNRTLNSNLNSAPQNLNCAQQNLNCATQNLNCAEVASTKAISLPVCAFTDVDSIIDKLRTVL